MNSGSKILFYVSFPPPFTGQRIATKFIYDLLKSHVDIDLINIASEKSGIKKPGKFSLTLAINYLYKYNQLLKNLKNKDYEYIYSIFAPSKFALLRDYIFAKLVKKYSKGRLVVHLHCGNYGDNFNDFFSRKIFKKLLKKVDVFIFLSPMLNKIKDLPLQKVHYLTNTISSEIICTDEEVAKKIELKKDRQILQIYYISNMVKEKGYLDLIEAILVLKEVDLNFKVHLIGAWPEGDNERSNCENKIKQLGLNDDVIIYGPIDNRKKLKDCFLQADVFVLPTYYPIEAQPLSIIEAFNSGTPVISTMHASIPDMIDDNLNGYLVPIRQPLEIAKSISKLIDYEQWSKMAIEARKKYSHNYTNEILLENLKFFFRFS